MKHQMSTILMLSALVLCLAGCGPAAGPAESASDTPEPAAQKYAVGDPVQFGEYNWTVLDTEADRALLLSDEIIALRFPNAGEETLGALQTICDETMPGWLPADFEGFGVMGENDGKYEGIYEVYDAYAEEHPELFSKDVWYTSWENSTLRSWLNSDLSFSEEEWAQILETEITDITTGTTTKDKVFLLSADQVEQYFPEDADRGAPGLIQEEDLAEYLKQMLALGQLSGNLAEKALNLADGGTYYWWVMNDDPEGGFVRPMETEEALGGIAPTLGQPMGIRPAMWIDNRA